VWAEAFVGEGSLALNNYTLRKVLGDNLDDQKYIVTAPKRGHRFVTKVTAAEASR